MNERTAGAPVNEDAMGPDPLIAGFDGRPRDGRRSNALRPAHQPRTDVIVLTLPLSAGDLVARLSALTEADRGARRVPRSDRRHLRFAGWALDLIERRLVAPGGGVVPLPGMEFALLRVFIDNPRRILSRADLADSTQRDGKRFRSARTVDVYVSRLRRRLSRAGGAPLIATAWRTGYVFEADVERT